MVDYSLLKKDQLINNFCNTKCFTTKVGLCNLLGEMRWNADVDPYSFIPRCYKLGKEEEKQEFIDDFLQTAARGILKWVSDAHSQVNPFEKSRFPRKQWLAKTGKRSTHKGRVGLEVLSTAMQICETHLNNLEHNDIDQKESKPMSPKFWKEFLRDYYRVIHDGASIDHAHLYAEQCRYLLNKLEAVFPQLDTEGGRNIWIVKPGAKSQGKGITCKDNLERILSAVDCDPVLVDEDLCVVQKYIERPLLIHGTKFDVRQWFLVTDWNPLTIWFYNRCYLRFSSQCFSLENLHSSVHLCNNAVQKHYKNSPKRHPDLPKENMWFDHQFNDYLQKIGATNAWDEIILPGMKEIIIQTMKTAQDKVDHRKNAFHLYGADFMFGENFQPWLIEINASPALSKSTSVNSILSAQVQEDILRVVLDRKQDSECYVGNFELLYKQPVIRTTQHPRANLLVKGIAMRKPHLLEKCHVSRVTLHDKQKVSVKPSNKVQDDRREGAKQCTKPTLEKEIKQVRDHSKERDNQRLCLPAVTKPAIEKPLEVKEPVLYKGREPIDLKLPKQEPVQALPKLKETKQVRGRSKERANENIHLLSTSKPTLEKPVLYKGREHIDLKLRKQETVQAMPKWKETKQVRDHSKERANENIHLLSVTKPTLEKPKVKEVLKRLDDGKLKPKNLSCVFCKRQICPKPMKPTLVPTDIFKRTQLNK
ncbi:hypothetical protein XELAEV_18024011mg [Xenopus laevis]|uniref:ATP-grasp domain-containing protein n=1 Tax=Xenopus laevis TaxID=8355 RepID=A0A974D800_XENLA|nr:hypothetical protein XELAEV_18024011mg [Xenopus laevis]